MKITLSGLPGSGTTSVATILSEKFGMECLSAGVIFRELARESGLSLEEFGKVAENDPKFDELIDRKQKEVASKRDNLLVEGRLSGHMIDADLKIWMEAPLEIRAERVAQREKLQFEEAKKEIIKREDCELNRYEEYYKIDLKDLSIYDLIIDSSKKDPESIAEIIISKVEALKRCN
ncbi:MAG: AAA family ATPase [Halobacteriota archaeon]|nr:AAA family ATPase [Halobacteriota archaeon]